MTLHSAPPPPDDTLGSVPRRVGKAMSPGPRWVAAAVDTHNDISAFLDRWADGADRSRPVSGEIQHEAAQLIGRSRKLLSRERRQNSVPPLPAGPLLPGDVVIALLKAAEAIQNAAERRTNPRAHPSGLL